MTAEKPIIFTTHARDKMADRGTTEGEVIEAIRHGAREAALSGRYQYRMNFEFHRQWQGKYYAVKQVCPVVAAEPTLLVVVTVYTYYF